MYLGTLDKANTYFGPTHRSRRSHHRAETTVYWCRDWKFNSHVVYAEPFVRLLALPVTNRRAPAILAPESSNRFDLDM